MTGRTRIDDVARAAGVSVASVSRVLNGLGATDDMARRVREAADLTNYQPDARGRSLKRGRSDQLSVMVADIGNPVYISMIRGIEKTVAAAGLRLLVASTGGDPDEESARLAAMGQGFADGLIISPLRVTPGLVAALRALDVPVVVIGGLPQGAGLDNVRANSPKGVDLLARHLVDQGRRRIAFLNGPADTVPGVARARGFDRVVAKYGLGIRPEWRVTAADFTFEAGLVAAAHLVDVGGFDTVICANDLLAVATLRVLGDAGLRVPEDVAVAGMDDTDIAGLVTPSLTSVDLGSYERGSSAAELLLARLADPDVAPVRRVVQPLLRVRRSTTVEASA